jgi:glycosyltransferase involved in cell wall biosynthesis
MKIDGMTDDVFGQDTLPDVSILIPIYNADRYLNECLDSVLNQTLRNIEIICINDGSSDRSAKIIEQAAKNDARVEVLTKKNTGYGDSLNQGLKRARAAYVGIIEADDFADPHMYQKLLTVATQCKADIVKSDFHEYKKDNEHKANIIPLSDSGKLISPCDNFAIFKSQPSVWSAIYLKSFLMLHSIIFTTSPGASFQDTSFNLKTLATSDKVWLMQDALVHYRTDNANSSIHSSKKTFAVCDEYDDFEMYMVKYPERFNKIKYKLQSIRFETYSWNLSRLEGASQREFYEHMYDKFTSLSNEGLINYDDFNDVEVRLLRLLLSGDTNFTEESIKARAAKYSA